MTLGEHEVPATQRAGQPNPPGGDELNPEDITLVNRPVYLLVIGALALALLVGIIGWIVLAMNDKSMPDGLAVLMGSVGGALVGLLASAVKK